jgi:hypothetical protein
MMKNEDFMGGILGDGLPGLLQTIIGMQGKGFNQFSPMGLLQTIAGKQEQPRAQDFSIPWLELTPPEQEERSRFWSQQQQGGLGRPPSGVNRPGPPSRRGPVPRQPPYQRREEPGSRI